VKESRWNGLSVAESEIALSGRSFVAEHNGPCFPPEVGPVRQCGVWMLQVVRNDARFDDNCGRQCVLSDAAPGRPSAAATISSLSSGVHQHGSGMFSAPRCCRVCRCSTKTCDVIKRQWFSCGRHCLDNLGMISGVHAVRPFPATGSSSN
jgi:hypothetical protein